jgi:hypothetical protein
VRRAVLVIALAACRSHETPPAPAPTPLTHATQQDLARELDAAERQGTWSQVRQRWQGQSLRWTVVRYHSLCAAGDACFVAPFAVERPAKHGWMPKLELAPAEYARLDRQCGAVEPCQVTFEGTLAELTASPEQPTSLRFANVHVL